MPIKNAIEGGRIAREIWAKRLGRKPVAVALNPDGTKVAKPAAPAAASKPSTKPSTKPTATSEAAKPTA